MPLGKINSRQKNKEGTEWGKDLMIVGESGGAECSDKETSDSQSLGILTLPGMGSSENSATDFVTELTVAKEHDEDEIDYPRRFYFSFEFIEKFDNFMMRLLLATPYRFREHYCDSSLSIEIAVLAALRDLERMDRENVQSVVVECLHEHIADHYENWYFYLKNPRNFFVNFQLRLSWVMLVQIQCRFDPFLLRSDSLGFIVVCIQTKFEKLLEPPLEVDSKLIFLALAESFYNQDTFFCDFAFVWDFGMSDFKFQIAQKG